MTDTIHRAPGAGDRDLAHRKLEEALQRGLGTGEQVMRRVLDQQPHDAMVKAAAARFTFEDTLTMTAGDGRWSFHPNAFGQLAEVVAPKGTGYLDALRDGAAWQHDLLATVLNETMQHTGKRHLVRSVGETDGRREARGFLSDSYRRLDSRPILEAFLQGVTSYGARPYGGSAMDCRYNLKAVLPEVIEPVPGEFLVLGVEWSNGDFGNAANNIREFMVRLWCLNGATGENALRQVHLGGRLGEGISFSDATIRKDTAATVSATRDVVRDVLSPEKRATLADRIRAAAETRTDAAHAFGTLAKSLTKEELQKARDAFDGPDVVNLPAEPTKWRASNVLSLMAQFKGLAPERREDLERMAGSLLRAAA